MRTQLEEKSDYVTPNGKKMIIEEEERAIENEEQMEELIQQSQKEIREVCDQEIQQ